MLKYHHEIRDPIHIFIRLNSDERRVIDSLPFQRLRNIHQLALTYLVYPGATHKRFEHSLGVMELAGRVFDIVTNPQHITDELRDSLPEISKTDKLGYWRSIIRMAALCHDLGHLPFSHAAEKELLPQNWDHERLTKDIILSNKMNEIWKDVKLSVEDITKIALGPQKLKQNFTIWETILSEIIVGDAFGVDRMDYLLRDSHHIGVAYGKFDHYRLIDSLRILPYNGVPLLGVEEGGIQSAEALLLARYLMYSQVYCHRIRRIYDIHLRDFLTNWLPKGKFSTNPNNFLKLTDNEIAVALYKATRGYSERGNHAKRIILHDHFKVLYERNPNDVKINPDAALNIYQAACKKFGTINVRFDRYSQKGGGPDFPVLEHDGRVVSSLFKSSMLNNLPVVVVEYIFVDRTIEKKAQDWLKDNYRRIIQPKTENKKGVT